MTKIRINPSSFSKNLSSKKRERFHIEHGDNLEVLKRMTPHQFDALVTDPPCGIGFMGKDWDTDKGGRDQWIAWLSEVLRECNRVMKPGAHGLIWAIPRTSHWTGIAIEDAGFEIVDVVMHLFGSGFPKSQDISKAIDKELGAEREVVGEKTTPDGKPYSARTPNSSGEYNDDCAHNSMAGKTKHNNDLTAPATPEAQKWNGWGTHLKPSHERWWLVRKPLKAVPRDDIQETHRILGGLIWSQLPARFVDLLSASNQAVSKGKAEFASAQWHALVLTTAANVGLFAMTDIFKSQETAEIFLSTVSLWNNIWDESLINQSTYTTKMVTAQTTELRTLQSLISEIMPRSTTKEEIGALGLEQSAINAEKIIFDVEKKLKDILTLFVLDPVLSEADSSETLPSRLQPDERGLKGGPSHEDWYLIRKPISESSIAKNVLKHGTGGLNIDSARIKTTDNLNGGAYSKDREARAMSPGGIGERTTQVSKEFEQPAGRFPANVLFSHSDGCECVGTKKVKPANGSGKAGKGANGFRSTYVGGEKDAEGFTGGFVSEDGTETVESWNCVDGCAVRELDLQTSHLHSAGFKKPKTGSNFDGSTSMFGIGDSGTEGERFGDSGGASRFFKVLPPDDSSRFFYVAKPSASEKHAGTEDGNGHPTVKPIKLMEELIRMVTPPGGTVLDPFMGSGTTGIAAIKNDFKFFGIDQEKKYTELAKNRMLGLYSVDEKKLKARKVNPAKQREQQRV